MSQVYNPEADTIAEIERLELTARNVLRMIDHQKNEKDKAVLNRQLQEMRDRIAFLRSRLP